VAMWKECKIVHGSPKHPQSQGSVERANADVERMVMQWMDDNNSTNWSWGIQFIGHMKNNRYHEGIKQIPYVLRYEQPCHVGLSRMNLPPLLLNGIQTEEQLQEALEQATIFVSNLRGITEDQIIIPPIERTALPANSTDPNTVVTTAENEPGTTDGVIVETTTENDVESTENNTSTVDEPVTTDRVIVETTTEIIVESTDNNTSTVDKPVTSDRDTVETTTENDVEATDRITDRETAVVNEAGSTEEIIPLYNSDHPVTTTPTVALEAVPTETGAALKESDTQSNAPDEEDYWTSLVLPDEPLRAGDVITYRSPIFVCGHSERGRTTTVLEVVSQRRCPLVLDNDKVLDKTQQVR
jgi:hypothetical protein